MDKDKITKDYLRRKFEDGHKVVIGEFDYLRRKLETGYEVVMGEFDYLHPDGGSEWIVSGTDLSTLIAHLYECSDKVRKSIDDALASGLTDPLELWFRGNEDLIVEEAWEHDWLELFSD